MSRPSRPGPLWSLVWASAVAAALGLAFAHAATSPGSHSRVLPLDDPYIYFVYARNTAAGHLLAYNPGDPASSGATSLLWTLLLALGFVFGVHGQGVVPWSLVLDSACLAAFVWTFALACRRAGAGWVGGGAAAAAAALYSRFAWGAFSGLEIPLSALAVALLAVALQAKGGPAVPLLGALLTLVRPDVGLAAIPAVLLWSVESKRTRNLWALLPAVVAAAYTQVWRVITGEPATNSAIVKTAFFAPGAHLLGLWSTLRPSLWIELSRLCSVAGHWNVWGLVLLSVSVLGLATRSGRALMAFAAAGFVFEALAFGRAVPGIQFGRYDLPFLIAIELGAATGLAWLARSARAPLWPAAAGALLLVAPTLRVGLNDYARDSMEIRGQQIAASTYIAQQLPTNAVVMLNDAGAMNYFGGRYTVDLVGLGTNGFALPLRSGTGAVYEALMDYLAARPAMRARPLYFVVYPEWFPGLDTAFGACPNAFTVPHPTILGGPTAVLCQAALPPASDPGLRVADLGLDAADHYSAIPPGRTWLLRLPDTDGTPRMASGRVVRGAEAFDLPSSPGQTLHLRAITTEINAVRLDVRVNGHDLGPWAWPAAPGRWERVDFTIPAVDVNSGAVHIILTGPERLTSEYLGTAG